LCHLRGASMDPISELVADAKIPIGRWGKSFFDFLTTNFAWFFDSLANGLSTILNGMVDGLLWLPPILIVALIVALAWWLKRSWKLALGVALGLLFIINQGLWEETIETLVLVVAAPTASMAMGVPIVFWAAHSELVYNVL